MQIDPRFRQMGQSARRRRARQAALRGGGLAAGLVAVLAGVWWQWSPQITERVTSLLPGAVPDGEMTQVDPGFDIAPIVRADTFGNIPGDPMIIPRAASDSAAPGRVVVAPEALRLSGQDDSGGGRLAVVRTALGTPDRMLLAPLPSTREEFAMFQAERSRASRDAAVRGETQPAVTLPAPGETVVSNTLFLRPAAQRPALWTDTIIETASPRDPADLLTANGLSPPEAARVAARIKTAMQVESIAPGSVLALRWRGGDDARQVIQLSLYAPQGYVGSLGMAGSGQLVAAADAWADQPLLADLLAREDGADYQPQRLMDMIYAAALREGLAPDQAGAAIAMMAQLHDLDAVVDPSDRLTVIRGEDRPGQPGALIYIGVSGASGDRSCYVVRDKDEPGAHCYTPRAVGAAGDLPPLRAPVAGAMTQPFLPPGDGEAAAKDGALRGHVVWSAAQGSPVSAVADGTVSAMLIDPHYGPSVEITHPGGMVSRYRGLGAIDPGVVQGQPVAGGAQLGVTGVAPGRSQPGLIFQLEQDGRPVDPAPRLGGTVDVPGSSAVEALIGRIIHVESGGNTRAKNPLSTASGLGQFIESTWLRMIRSYHPELTASLSRRELLDLRFDPDMSRDMVRRLAQENEAYLRARGHSISPGRLYLAHFLGPAGADIALRADASRSVLEVMGPGVVGANPFLRGYSIADLRGWADRKMGAAVPVSASVAAAPVPEVPPEMRQLIALIDQIRGSI